MSEIQLTVQDQYMAAFLEFIKTLPYIEVQHVKPAVQTKSAIMLEQIPADAPIRRVIRTTRKSKKSLNEIARHQNYRGTNLDNLKAISLAMDLQEPIEDLLSQLNH